MEKFYLEEVNFDRKDDIIDYVSEFKEYNSDIHGTGGFHHILDGQSFESILEKETMAFIEAMLMATTKEAMKEIFKDFKIQ